MVAGVFLICDKNKTMKRLILTFTAALALVACSKDTEEQKISNNVSSTLDLNVPDNFDWKTTQQVKVVFNALPAAPSLNRTLVISNEDGDILTKRFVNLSEGTELELTVPASATYLHATIGKFEKKVKLVGGQAAFDMSIEIDNSDLD